MAKKIKDIRETGPQSYRTLQQQNNQVYNSNLNNEILNLRPVHPYKSTTDNIYEGGEYSPLQQSGNGYLGKSQYDNTNYNPEEYTTEGIQDIRHDNQPWYDTLANGVGKMLGTAGTTFVSSLIGLPYGLFEAARQGRWSAIWDNDVTNGLSSVDKWMEENMTNYKSVAQQNAPWYDPDNLFSMNFIADDIIKNAGFTLGAAASMAVGSGSLGLLSKSLGFVNEVGKTTKAATNLIGALFSATGEGMIEAKQGVDGRNKLEMQRLDNSFIPQRKALELEYQNIIDEYNANRGKQLYRNAEGVGYDPARITYEKRLADLQKKKELLDTRYEAAKNQIIESGQNMGNAILLANQGLLTVGNLIQFSRTMTKSFNNARHAAEIMAKDTKPFGVRAVRNAKGLYDIKGKTPARVLHATKGLFTEGSEEMNQQWIQSSSNAAYDKKDVNDYWRARLDSKSYRKTTEGLYTLGNILSTGFQDSWGDINQWEQFVVGGLTGLAGSYAPTKLFNQDKTKSIIDPRRYGSWEGGIINENRKFKKQYDDYAENVNEVNKILSSNDFAGRVSRLSAHTYLESQKNDYAENNEKKLWKDADDKQTIHDIQAFLRAGKLDDLRAIYNEMGKSLSDDDIESIVKSTTKEISAEEDKQNYGKNIDAEIVEHQNKINSLNEEAEKLADDQEALEGEDRNNYRNTVRPIIENIYKQIDEENDAIDKLTQDKESYVGKKHYIGAYVAEDGHRIATNDEIRKAVQHNVEELNRKLDSYLDSVDAVQKDTRGKLTRDQEDNLVYLHNVGREKLERATKIAGSLRKKLPSKFLFRTDKTPEQLTKEYNISDLVFSKDENTKEGYVEVDTSLLNDNDFRNIFVRDILMGGNINKEFGETADEKALREQEEKTLSKEEQKQKRVERFNKRLKQQEKDAQEQRENNYNLIEDNFRKTYRRDTNSSEAETLAELIRLGNDIADTAMLVSEAGQYYKTLYDYMNNPTLVDRDKKKEEENLAKEEEKKQTKSKFVGKSSKDISRDLSEGVISASDLEIFASATPEEARDEELKRAQEEAKKANEKRKKVASLKEKVINNVGENPTKVKLEATNAALQSLTRAELESDTAEDIVLDNPNLSQISLDDLTEQNVSQADLDDIAKAKLDILSEAFTEWQEDVDTSAQLIDPKTLDEAKKELKEGGVNLNDDDNTTGHDATSKSKPATVALETKKQAKKETPVAPILETAIDKIIEETSKLYDKVSDVGQWRSTTRRFGYHSTTTPYHETISDKNSKEYKRSKAIWEYLNEQGAFDRVDATGANALEEGETVHFMVKYLPEVFGKEYKDLTEEEKPYALAIIILNDKGSGEVLGDLPLYQLAPAYRRENPSTTFKQLIGFQDQVFKAFEENFNKNGNNEAIVDFILHKEGMGNLNMTFKNNKPLIGKIDKLMVGVVPFSRDQRNTLNSVIGNSNIEIGVMTHSGAVGTSVDSKTGKVNVDRNVRVPAVGSKGQPYILLRTPKGTKIAVPIYTEVFDANKHKDTELYKMIANTLFELLQENPDKVAYTNIFNKYTDLLSDLLQVDLQEGAKKLIEYNGNTATLHLQRLNNGEPIDITVPFNGNKTDLAIALANGLSGTPINIRATYINGTFTVGEGSNKRTTDYNKMIGEIATVNLRPDTTHTVNNWFTVIPDSLAKSKPKQRDDVKSLTKVTEVISGKQVTFNLGKNQIEDKEGKPIAKEDITEALWIRMAQIRAANPLHRGKERIKVTLNGVTRTYDVKNNKFVTAENSSPKITPSSTPSSASTAGASAPQTSELNGFDSSVTDEDLKAINQGGVSLEGTQDKKEEPKEPTREFKDGEVTYNKKHDNNSGVTTISFSNYRKVKSGAVKQVLHGGLFIDKTVIHPDSIENGLLDDYKNIVLHEVRYDNSGRLIGDITVYYNDDTHQDYTVDLRYIPELGNLTNVSESAPVQNNFQEKDNLTQAKEKVGVTPNMEKYWDALSDEAKLALGNGDTIVIKGKKITIDNFSNSERILKMAMRDGKIEANVKAMEKKNSVVLEKEREREARKWLAKNLPSLNSEERTQFVDKLLRGGSEMWGNYRNGVIEILNGAPRGTVYHEAFHYVMDMLVSDTEKERILGIAKEAYNTNDTWEAEERLANDFRRYVMDENATGIIGKLKRWFRSLKDKITRHNRIKDTTINQLFWQINNGKFANKSLIADRVSRNNQQILREIRNVQIKRLDWNNLAESTREAIEESGLTEEAYNKMCLEEKEQYVKCRG